VLLLLLLLLVVVVMVGLVLPAGAGNMLSMAVRSTSATAEHLLCGPRLLLLLLLLLLGAMPGACWLASARKMFSCTAVLIAARPVWMEQQQQQQQQQHMP
jgi:hypothetical protein